MINTENTIFANKIIIRIMKIALIGYGKMGKEIEKSPFPEVMKL